jgi:hypothetical protein
MSTRKPSPPTYRVATLDPDQLLETLAAMRATDSDAERSALFDRLAAGSTQHRSLEDALTHATRPRTLAERFRSWLRGSPR